MSVQVKGSGTIGGLDEGLVVSGIVTSSTQINVGSNIKLGNAGVITATSFVGSGSQLTGISGVSVANQADNRLITATGTTDALNGEANLTFDGTEFKIPTGASTQGLFFQASSGANANLRGVGSNYGELGFFIGNSERLRITSSGHISQGGAAEPSSSNGGVAKKFGIKSNANNVIIGETESSGSGSGLHIESRQTGRSGGARIAQIGMKNDSSGNGQISFFTSPSGADVRERMVINSHGLVTRPSQYHLHADRSGNQTGYNAGGDFGTPMIFNQIVSETKDSTLSSCFNTSNGLFTAPVTGVYIFNASVYTSSSGNIFSQSWFTLNGGRASGTDWVINAGYAFVQNTQVMRLAAGNTVGFKPYAGGQSNVTLSAHGNHTYFKVTLIG